MSTIPKLWIEIQHFNLQIGYEECSFINPYRCQMGDTSGKHGVYELGGGPHFFTDVNLPLVGRFGGKENISYPIRNCHEYTMILKLRMAKHCLIVFNKLQVNRMVNSSGI